MGKKAINWERFKQNLKPTPRRFCLITFNVGYYTNINTDTIYEIVQEGHDNYWIIDNAGKYQRIEKSHAIPIKSSIVSLGRYFKK